MPLIQKYHHLDRKTPKTGQKVILFKKSTSKNDSPFSKVHDECFIFVRENDANDLVFDHINQMYKIPHNEKHLFQYIVFYELNQIQKWFGRYYSGLIFLVIILWFITDLLISVT